MATLITVNSFTPLDNISSDKNAASSVTINTSRIVSVKTRGTAYRTTGVTDLVYALPVNQKTYIVNLIVTEAASALITAANA